MALVEPEVSKSYHFALRTLSHGSGTEMIPQEASVSFRAFRRLWINAETTTRVAIGIHFQGPTQQGRVRTPTRRVQKDLTTGTSAALVAKKRSVRLSRSNTSKSKYLTALHRIRSISLVTTSISRDIRWLLLSNTQRWDTISSKRPTVLSLTSTRLHLNMFVLSMYNQPLT